MAMSQDSDLTALQPDILSLGISAFTSEHAKSQADIERELRNIWWAKTGRTGELTSSKLTESQFTRCSAFLVLWKYALPKLSTWGDGDRFLEMIKFYRIRFDEEFAQILKDGVEYDADGDGTITNDEKVALHHGRLTR
jgi:hypothetical protein